ncbi:RPA12 (YJR063W) [Zygosaccharomyces parabailii]|uniref:DNA-directed RNA polymerase subunit n=1 Tax=Zygosaccharomyces bailii (strain CLIB 213 / ATCC 58445 / CBS 680 / BCRC 21525 / NBRC 1098 / NCYC 1416 / NRRL Y-2227) TaxID=1333698 RepID=A0A8J2T5Y4_ZYGB2|nr:RPA12 (YJR063W) [Zygosaccharomyces parabailii]CDF88675.1 BN860_15808g1_1 [Zygosaccharomyces bailii CLIB 213]
MSVVGSLIFCLDCGDLLENPSTVEGIEIECSQCQAKYPKSKFSNLKVVTSTSADAFPSSLKLKQSVVKTSLGRDELKEGATIKEKCPKCGNDEMHYYTLQLRSADEGATVFYTCTNCGYKFRTNN